MALVFPTPTVDGELYTDPATGRKYQYNLALNVWKAYGGQGEPVFVTDKPVSPEHGSLFYDPATDTIEVYSKDAASWGGLVADAQVSWSVTATGTSAYVWSGDGFIGMETNPVIYVVRGQKYSITNSTGAHPLRIQTVAGLGGAQYNDGITGNDVSNGTLTWEVRMDAPDTLYYQCTTHAAMGGTINVLSVGGGGGTDTQGYIGAVDPNTTAPYNTTQDSNARTFIDGDNFTRTDTGAQFYHDTSLVAGSKWVQLPSAAPATPIAYGTAYSFTDTPKEVTYFGSGAGSTAVANDDHASGDTYIGWSSGTNITGGGGNNTCVGHNTMGLNAATGSNNTCLGYIAGYRLTSGFDNILIGALCGDAFNDGFSNVAIGASALRQSVSNESNVAVGHRAGRACRSNSNIFLGAKSGESIVTGGGNIVIGGWNGISTTTNQIIIGRPNDDAGTHDNSIALQINQNNAIGVANSSASNNPTVSYGTTGQVLTSQGSSLPPKWDAARSILPSNAAIGTPYNEPNFNVWLHSDNVSSPQTINMTAAGGTAFDGDEFVIETDGFTATNNVTVTLTNYTFMDGTNSKTLNANYQRLSARFSEITSTFYFKID